MNRKKEVNMQTIILILLPWVVFGVLEYLKWQTFPIRMLVSLVFVAIYGLIILAISLWLDRRTNQHDETALDRAKKVMG